jgi:geranylgeranyl diphosphate synthase type II
MEGLRDAGARIEHALRRALDAAEEPGIAPRLAEAMRYAVFPGGARARPLLCLAVAEACGDDAPEVADTAAAAIELLHCASLVHDDLPCFDDAALRRGRLALHREFGVPLAVLAGDALIVLAFQCLARGAPAHPGRLVRLVRIIGDAVGAPVGMVAGQAVGSDLSADPGAHHAARTGALFAAAAAAGAVAAGACDSAWRPVGQHLGAAHQIADQIRGVIPVGEEAGGRHGHKAMHERPGTLRAGGLEAQIGRLDALASRAVAAIPPCPGRGLMEALIRAELSRLVQAGRMSCAA